MPSAQFYSWRLAVFRKVRIDLDRNLCLQVRPSGVADTLCINLDFKIISSPKALQMLQAWQTKKKLRKRKVCFFYDKQKSIRPVDAAYAARVKDRAADL